MRPVLRTLAAASVAALLAVASSCGGDDGSELSEAARNGRDISRNNGCAACHGNNGQGGVGPSWVGLAGSERVLEDGTTVIADRDYLYRSISDPAAEVVAGYSVRMPTNGLDDSQIADVIAYIEELSQEPAGG
jgi:cytochrome c oxidase subunit 2